MKNCIIVGFFFYSIFDLQMSNPDPLLPSLLERTPADELDLANQEDRQLHRMHSLFSIYPIQQVSRENRSLLLIVIGSVVKGRILRKLTMFIVEVNLEPQKQKKFWVLMGTQNFFLCPVPLTRWKTSFFLSLLRSKLSSILFYLQMKNMFH